MIKKNDKKLAVCRLQMQLRRLKIYSGLIDGQFGSGTDSAVREYQQKRGLSVDGIVGPYTDSKLKSETDSGLFVLFLHCAATPEGRDVKGSAVASWHTNPKPNGRGWSRPGYSDVIELDGTLVNLREWNQDDKISEWEYTFGVKFETLLNRNARHVCYIGGTEPDNVYAPKDTRTDAQKRVMELYIKWNLVRNPDLIIAGHNQVQPKACPSFLVPQYLRSIGIPEWNIANWGLLYE